MLYKCIDMILRKPWRIWKDLNLSTLRKTAQFISKFLQQQAVSWKPATLEASQELFFLQDVGAWVLSPQDSDCEVFSYTSSLKMFWALKVVVQLCMELTFSQNFEKTAPPG